MLKFNLIQFDVCDFYLAGLNWGPPKPKLRFMVETKNNKVSSILIATLVGFGHNCIFK
jgi:hypothetical protein